MQVWKEDGVWHPLVSYTVDSLCPPGACDGCGDAYVGSIRRLRVDVSDVHGTPWFSLSVPIPPGELGVRTLRFKTASAQDLSHTTVVLLDQITLAPCAPECGDAECGGDGCGGSCGQCSGEEMCSQEGMCCAPQCEGKSCGDDGCGGSCGSCGKLGICEAASVRLWRWSLSRELGEDCETCPQDCGKDTCPEPDCPPDLFTTV